MTRLEKAAEVRRLRDEEGLIWREIGERMGLSKSMAFDLYDDPTGEKARARKRRYERPCVDCGKTTNPNGIRGDIARCRKCAGEANPRTDPRVDRVLQMVELRNRHRLNNKEIAERLGVPVATVSTELHRMRTLGFRVPAAPYNNARLAEQTCPPEPQALTLGRALARRGVTPERAAA